MRCRVALFVAASLAGICPPVLPAAEPEVLFNRDIRPILSDKCFTCHGPDANKRPTALRLDQADSALAERGGFRAFVPGKPDESEAFVRIASNDETERMPPAKSGPPLSAREIGLIRQWIEQGAKYQPHWAFQAPVRPALPSVSRSGWTQNGIDHFILARLDRDGLSPRPEAPRETLLRRATLDLTGLPPTLEELDAFLADPAPDAYERAVDRLLASPRYGERMVLEWLDAARYSDSNGYQTDGTRPMWPWRDWVVRALNANMPFDQFTVEQIAGDMLPQPTLEQKIATGFNRNHMLNGEGGRIAEESRVDYVVDRVETTATVWLGLTLGCARCHDHKYDPFLLQDFYGIYAYYNNVNETGGVDRRNSTAAPILEMPTPEQIARRKELDGQIQSIEDKLEETTERILPQQPAWELTVTVDELPVKVAEALLVPAAQRTDAQAAAVKEHFLSVHPETSALEAQSETLQKSRTDLANSILLTMVMEERKEPRETFILVRGQYDKYGDKVSARVPEQLAPLPQGAPNNRLGLAEWLVSRSNPLTARVTVNRQWQMFFGLGLVKTTEDFGTQGELPSHPELLDWLALEFQRDWDMKRLHKLIVTSAAYRQASTVTPELIEKDPENRLVSRGPRFRLNSHIIRDQALAWSGLIMERQGGAPVRPYQPPGLWEDFSFGRITYQQDHGADLYRRSLYTFWRRSVAPATMFDTPARQVCTVKQPRTNTPLHALTLLNDVTFVEAARVFAERMLKAPANSTPERIALAFRTVVGRAPRADELRLLEDTLDQARQRFQAAPEAAAQLAAQGEYPRDAQLAPVEVAAWTGLASVLFNLDEAMTKE